MPGIGPRDEIGSAFVSIGGDLNPLKKAFEVSQRLTQDSMNVLAKMTSNFNQQFAGGLEKAAQSVSGPGGLMAGIGALLKQMYDLDSTAYRFQQNFLLVLPSLRQVEELMGKIEKQAQGSGYSTQRMLEAATRLRLGGVPPGMTQRALELAIGGAEKTGRPLEAMLGEVGAVFRGQSLGAGLGAAGISPLYQHNIGQLISMIEAQVLPSALSRRRQMAGEAGGLRQIPEMFARTFDRINRQITTWGRSLFGASDAEIQAAAEIAGSGIGQTARNKGLLDFARIEAAGLGAQNRQEVADARKLLKTGRGGSVGDLSKAFDELAWHAKNVAEAFGMVWDFVKPLHGWLKGRAQDAIDAAADPYSLVSPENKFKPWARMLGGDMGPVDFLREHIFRQFDFPAADAETIDVNISPAGDLQQAARDLQQAAQEFRGAAKDFNRPS